MSGKLVAALSEAFGDACSTQRFDREEAASDSSDMAASLPAAVVWPQTTEDVLFVLELCRQHRAPLTPRGGGTSRMGNPIPVRGGVVLDMTRMNAIVATHPADRRVVVQPGVTCDQLNQAVAEHGLFFAPATGGVQGQATIGGMVAKNSSGGSALKYGATRDHVLGLTVVTGAGEIIRTGHQCPKASSAYDLTSLIVGSEGTLAVVTEVTLRLSPVPRHRAAVGFEFVDEATCAATVGRLVASGLDLAVCEYLGSGCVEALNAVGDYGLPARPVLALEVHGATASIVAGAAEAATALCVAAGARPLALAGDPFALRHGVESAIRARHPETLNVWSDLAFPPSTLPEVVELAETLASESGVCVYAYGHAAMGILYVVIPARPDDIQAWEAASDVREELVQFVVDRGGSCSGQSGIGLANRHFVRREHGMAVEVMRRVKAALDPDGLLNPGKVLP